MSTEPQVKTSSAVPTSILNASLRNAGEHQGVCWEEIGPTNKALLGRVLILPGLTSPYHSKYVPVYRDTARFIASCGFRVATFAYRGQLGSTGEYSFPSAVEDAISVLDTWYEHSPGAEPLGLLARSSGCPIALRVARCRRDVRSVLLWGGSPKNVYERLFGPKSDGTYMKACTDCGSRMSADFTNTLFFPEDEIPACDTPVVWLGIGTDDEYTTPSEQISMALASKANRAALHIIPRCPHSVSSANPAWHSFRDLLAAWLSATIRSAEA